MKVNTRRLAPGDVETARGFVRKFHHRDISTDYLAKFLGNASNFLVVAGVDGAIIGYVLAYQIDRVDQDAASMFIYDIEVEDGHRRGGAGAALISPALLPCVALSRLLQSLHHSCHSTKPFHGPCRF